MRSSAGRSNVPQQWCDLEIQNEELKGITANTNFEITAKSLVTGSNAILSLEIMQIHSALLLRMMLLRYDRL